MPRGELPSRLARSGFDALPAESDYVSPFAVRDVPVAPMAGGYTPTPEVLAQLAALGFNPQSGVSTPSGPVSSPFTVQGVTPSANPNEVISLAVPGVPSEVKEQAKADLVADPNVTVVPGSLENLSQFGGLGALDKYAPDFSGAFGGSGSSSGLQGAPTSFAFPENYGNPKNKIYNLTAGPEDNIRLKFVDGTTMFEGKGPEAAAKAAAIVQELGKKFNTQSTWILDKQTAGGDWKQVSQDTVGEKKKTALNAFLDVAAPIAGALLAVIPGVGLVALQGAAAAGAAGAGAAAAGGLGLSTATAGALGAAGGSLLNSGLQNQNSAEAFKKAALAAASSYIGAKIGAAVSGGGGISPTSLDPTSAVGIRNLAAKGFSPEKIAGMATAAGENLTAAQIQTIITEGATRAATSGLSGAAGDVVIKGLTTGAGTAGAVVGGTAGAGLSGAGGLTSATGGAANLSGTQTQSGLDTVADNTAVNDVQIMGEGALPDTQVGLDIAGGVGGTGITSGVNTDFQVDGGKTDAELEIEGEKAPPPKEPVVGIDPNLVADIGTPVNPTPETIKVTGEKEPPPKEPVVAVDPNLVADIGTPVNPTPETIKVTGEKEPPPKEPLTPTPVTLPTTTTPTPGLDAVDVPMPDKPPVKEPEPLVPVPPIDGTTITTPNVNPTLNPPTNPIIDTIKEVLPLVPLIGGLGGAGGAGGAGGSGTNTLTYPGGNQPGTPGSLGGVFTSKLPTRDPALAVTPRDMGQRDWLRYGFGPEASFFSNVPDRQALAVNPAPTPTPAPVAQTSPLEVKPAAAPTAAGTLTSTPTPTPTPTQEPKIVGGIANGTRNPDGSGTVWMNGNWAFVDPVYRPPTAEERAEMEARNKANREKAFADARKSMGLPEGFDFPTPSGVAGMPALSEKLNEPTSDLAVKADESRMPPPEEIVAQPAFARGGSTGGTSRKPRTEFAVHGAGTGRSDDIPAVLSDGEYVMDAETVALLGDGSSKAGAEKLDQLRVNLRRHKGANLAKGRFSVNAKSPEKYLAGGRV